MAAIYFVEISPVDGISPKELTNVLKEVESAIKKNTTDDTLRFKVQKNILIFKVYSERPTLHLKKIFD